MAFLESIAIMGGLAVAILATSAVVCSWVRGWSDGRPLLLEEMLRRHGEDISRLAAAGGSRSLSLALRRCQSCGEMARCRAWLDSGAREGYEAFCPNAGYVSRVSALAVSARHHLQPQH